MAMSSFQFKTATTAIASQSSVILLIFVGSTITNAFQTVRTLQFYWLEQIHRMNQLYKEELLLRIAMFICYFVFETERIPLLIRLTIMLLTEAESKLSATNRFFSLFVCRVLVYYFKEWSSHCADWQSKNLQKTAIIFILKGDEEIKMYSINTGFLVIN